LCLQFVTGTHPIVIFLVSQDYRLCLGVDRLLDGIRTRSLESHRRDGTAGAKHRHGHHGNRGLVCGGRIEIAHQRTDKHTMTHHNELFDNDHRSLAIAHQHRSRLRCTRTPFASANHNLHIMAVMLAGGGGRFNVPAYSDGGRNNAGGS
jgi:hypothetical protein